MGPNEGWDTHLNLDGPGEVADVDEEGDVGAVAEVKVLVGEAVPELLDVAPGDDGDLLPGLRASCRTDRRSRKDRRVKRGRGPPGCSQPKLGLNTQSGIFWYQDQH